MVRIAYDPTPYHFDHGVLELPDIVARLGYEYLQLTPHPEFGPFHRRPKADDDLVDALRKRAADAGVKIVALQPVQRISWPEEPQREAAVRNFSRVIEICERLGVDTINTEFSGRPERGEDSEAGFYRSMEELIPKAEKAGVRINIDPHPDDFVEDGLEAWRVIRGLNSKQVGFVYVGSHTFHMGDRAATLIPEVGDRLGAVFVADTYDHHRSNGLRYITNPPGNPARVHQHNAIGNGDVDWQELFDALGRTGYLDREDAVIVSNVFGENESADEVAPSQRERILQLIEAAARS
ncbi:sugar phosphate isomerase/epimerase [Gulosibacter sp. 10]|uniref:sugar phosphate isomerase/epimerase family protein n=1 Tax=Gulosibacter sp. 10 TaxID=1255570 RepID=UPI00097E82FB|nr:sugar phosphate isomerase/epimerase [Gulosibacter sp. 10]SJM55382.1 Glyceraldehyde-3-phosphate ketol-isomerase [Gulosibacter sp. 10]